jgi:hypothetical protein
MERTAAASLALVGALVLHGDAQPSAPIYLQYDGFVRNKDAHTITMSFGYYNLNHTDVTIQPGEDNKFIPGPVDRQQPVVLLEGRHRFACTIVVPEDFTGKLQWQVTFAGKPQITTEKVLNPLYELEMGSERRAMAGLDVKSAPKNICANHAPNVQVGGTFNANVVTDVNAPTNIDTPPPTSFATSLDRELALPGQVNDDDLPRGSKVAIAWKKTAGAGNVTFSSTTTAATRVKFSAAGSYDLELSATDGDKTSSARIRVNVVEPGKPLVITERAADEYTEAMKKIQAAQTALRGQIGSRNYDGAGQTVSTLKDAFLVAQAYWNTKSAADATTQVNAALKSVTDLDNADRAKSDQGLLEAQTAMGRTCGACHTAHRERLPDGHFEIK